MCMSASLPLTLVKTTTATCTTSPSPHVPCMHMMLVAGWPICTCIIEIEEFAGCLRSNLPSAAAAVGGGSLAGSHVELSEMLVDEL